MNVAQSPGLSGDEANLLGRRLVVAATAIAMAALLASMVYAYQVISPRLRSRSGACQPLIEACYQHRVEGCAAYLQAECDL
jgi:hypothetical protein